jgi:hypothetical protein
MDPPPPSLRRDKLRIDANVLVKRFVLVLVVVVLVLEFWGAE